MLDLFSFGLGLGGWRGEGVPETDMWRVLTRIMSLRINVVGLPGPSVSMSFLKLVAGT